MYEPSEESDGESDAFVGNNDLVHAEQPKLRELRGNLVENSSSIDWDVPSLLMFMETGRFIGRDNQIRQQI